MVAVSPAPMSVQDFIEWEDAQAEKHELVDGAPVLRRLRLMAGGTPEHALIAANVVRSLGNRLAGKPCRPFGSDLRVLNDEGGVRYPDVTVLCRPLRRGEKAVADPTVLVEVLSASNSAFQMTRLLQEYQVMASVAQVALVNQDKPFVQLWTRDGATWTVTEIEGIGADLRFAALDVIVPLEEVYDGVEL